MIRSARTLVLLGAFAGLVACGADGPGADVTAPAPMPDGGDAAAADDPPLPALRSFVALSPDFASFPTWHRLDVDGAANPVHGAGRRSVYINRLPPHGATRFPVGTTIVKTMPGAGGETFAMAKRAGEFNQHGAVDWEWFELTNTDGRWQILWRGITPPTGEVYGGIEGGSCNDCHAAAQGNDFVQTPALRLPRP